MTEKKKTDGRGGRREGAGRPRSGSKLYTFRAPKEIARIIEEQENKTEFIKKCISDVVRISEPDFSQVGEVIPASSQKEFQLPFFDLRIVAGFPIPLDNDERAEDIDLLRMLCPYPESSYLIRVTGDSMIDAGIESGDIIIVDKSKRNPSETEVAVCELNGEYTIKYVHIREGRGVLVPANPAYPEIPINDSDDFSIWGVVTYIIHKPK